MATRLYGVATTAAPITPAFDANWQDVTGAARRGLSLSKDAATETRAAVAVTSGAGNETLGFQLISDPLEAQTITGTVTLVTRGRELANTDNIALRMHSIRVVSNDGTTYRSPNLIAFGSGTLTTELTNALAGRVHLNVVAVSSVSAQAGDRLVVEIGYGMNTTGTTPQYDMVIGGNGTDHTTTDGDTTGTVAWVELSQNLAFQAPAGPPPLVMARHL